MRSLEKNNSVMLGTCSAGSCRPANTAAAGHAPRLKKSCSRRALELRTPWQPERTNAHLSQNNKPGLVGCESEHDQVCVQAIEAVPEVRVPARPAALLAHVRHDLVLPLSR